MIWLTRFNGQQFVLNSDLIKSIESTPDTVITLTQGEKLMIKEGVEAVINAVVHFRQRLYRELPIQELPHKERENTL